VLAVYKTAAGLRAKGHPTFGSKDTVISGSSHTFL